MDWKRRVALLAVPAVLAIGGGALVVHAATPPPTPPKSQAAEPAEVADPVEAAGAAGAAEAPEAPEAPGAPEVGRADPAGANTDNQFEGEQ